MKLILASNSPRRKEILQTLNIPFEIIPADIEETINPNNPIESEIEKLSFLKAQDVYNKHKDSIVVGSDTIVYQNNMVLGKPKDKEDAKRMLQQLQDSSHQVITAVTIMSNDSVVSFHNTSTVYFNKMSDKEIDDYIKTNEPMDKAGAYAIQGLGGKFIKKIDGDYYSIMGLPLNELYNKLKELNVFQ